MTKDIVKDAINHVLTKHIYADLNDTELYEAEIKHEIQQYIHNFHIILVLDSVKLISKNPFKLLVRYVDDNKFVDLIATINIKEETNENSIDK